MARESQDHALSRRAFLASASGAMTGIAAYGMVGAVEAQQRQLKRGGVLRFATRGDTQGLDPHRNLIYLVSDPLAATTQGLLCLFARGDVDRRADAGVGRRQGRDRLSIRARTDFRGRDSGF